MGCNCGQTREVKEYIAQYSDGTSATYRTKIEASASIARRGTGGSVREVVKK
jgi:hypothetical protein